MGLCFSNSAVGASALHGVRCGTKMQLRKPFVQDELPATSN